MGVDVESEFVETEGSGSGAGSGTSSSSSTTVPEIEAESGWADAFGYGPSGSYTNGTLPTRHLVPIPTYRLLPRLGLNQAPVEVEAG